MIKTERLLLREYTMSDFEALYSILSDPITMQYYPHPYDEAYTRKWIDWNLKNYEKYGFGLWAVDLKDGGFIGDCGLTMQNIDGKELPEIGYHIHRDCWHRGYAKEAAHAVRDWAFANTEYDELFSYMNKANQASIATALSNGMTKRKEFTDANGEELCVCSITRSEWKGMAGI